MGDSRQIRAVSHRILSSCRRRADGVVQLALRAPARRDLRPPQDPDAARSSWDMVTGIVDALHGWASTETKGRTLADHMPPQSQRLDKYRQAASISFPAILRITASARPRRLAEAAGR